MRPQVVKFVQSRWHSTSQLVQRSRSCLPQARASRRSDVTIDDRASSYVTGALAFATDATQISKAPKKRDGINMDSVAISKGNCVSLDRNLRATA